MMGVCVLADAKKLKLWSYRVKSGVDFVIVRNSEKLRTDKTLCWQRLTGDGKSYGHYGQEADS